MLSMGQKCAKPGVGAMTLRWRQSRFSRGLKEGCGLAVDHRERVYMGQKLSSGYWKDILVRLLQDQRRQAASKKKGIKA